MMSGHVEVDHVSKRYGEFWAVKQVSFSIQTGAFVTLLGPSGCGKTTTLRLIAGFETLNEGEIRIGGQIVNEVPPWRRHIGVVFQNYALFPHMKVFDNVAFGLQMQRVGKEETRRRVVEALDMVNLPGLDDRYPRQLSGGQQQRVALARALVLKPDVLLLDEPLSNLDAKLRAEMRFELKRIQNDVGVTTVFVTHDQEEALTMSDYIVVMNAGEIRQTGSPKDIWEHPQDDFVADFFGTENLLKGEVVERDEEGELVVRPFVSQEMLIKANSDTVQSGEGVVVGIRSIDIGLFAQKPAELNNVYSGRVLETNYKGDFITYQVATELNDKPLVVTMPTRNGFTKSVWLHLPAEKLMVFRS